MSQVKRAYEAHEEMVAAIEALGIEEKALVSDEDSDGVTSSEDRQAARDFYA